MFHGVGQGWTVVGMLQRTTKQMPIAPPIFIGDTYGDEITFSGLSGVTYLGTEVTLAGANKSVLARIDPHTVGGGVSDGDGWMKLRAFVAASMETVGF